MRVTVIPAQVTTVEDRIVGNLGLSQLMLLAIPVFASCIMYVILPPTLHRATYKLVMIIIAMFACSLLAVRVKGKILLLWLVIILRYNLRPKHYVFNKNSMFAREEYGSGEEPKRKEEDEARVVKISRLAALSASDAIRAQDTIKNPANNVTFETNRRGVLYVRITEVKEQS